MNSLDDLRTTLHTHAHDLDGIDPVSRTSGIRARVAEQRRRRNAVRGGVALAAVAAVVSGLALTDLGSGPTPDPAAALGAPESFTALGWTYELADAVETDGSTQTTSLPASERPYLISWKTEGEGQDVTVTSDGQDVWFSAAADWADHVVIPAGEAQEVTVSATGDDVEAIAVATYEIDPSEIPAGQGSGKADGFHFRENVADRVLVDAAVAEGRNEIRFEYTVPGETVTLTHSCSGVPEGAWVWISLDGSDDASTWGEGCNDNGFDPGAGSNFSFDVNDDGWAKQGTVRMWVSRSETDPTPVADSEVTRTKLGVGLYSSRASDEWPDAPRQLEHAGHTWQIARTIDAEPGTPIRLDPFGTDEPGPRLLQDAVKMTGKEAARTALQIDGKTIEERLWPGGKGMGSSGETLLSPTAETAGGEITRGGADAARFAFTLYRLAD